MQSKPAPTRTRTIAYVRVSTEKQADEGVSLDAQRAKLNAYCQVYDLELVALEADEGLSAKTLDRPGLQRALEMLARGEAEALLVPKLDRLTRSVVDLGELIQRCNREGWALMSISENIDTRTAAGRLVLNVLGSVSQWEREAIGERTAEAMKHKRSQGEYTGGRCPYGFKLAADAKTLVPCKRERAAAHVALELRAAGASLRAVGRELEARGLKPRSSASWNPKTVRDLLRAAA